VLVGVFAPALPGDTLIYIVRAKLG